MFSNSGDVVVCFLVQRMKKFNKFFLFIVLDIDMDEYQLLKVKGKQFILCVVFFDDKGRYFFCLIVDYIVFIWDVRNFVKFLYILKVKEVVVLGFFMDLQLFVVMFY